MNDDYIERLGDLLYESVMDESSFRPAMEGLSEFMGQRRSMLFRWQHGVQGPPEIKSAVAARGLGFETFLPAYAEHYHRIDPGKDKWDSVNEGQWLHEEQTHAPRIWSGSEFYQDFALAQGVGGWSVFKLAGHESHRALPAWTITFMREKDSPLLDTEALERFKAQLAPHLRRALSLRDRMADVRSLAQLGLAALNRCTVPLWLVEQNGKILYSNEAALGYLHTKTALLGTQFGCLQLRSAGNQGEWQNMLVLGHKEGNSAERVSGLVFHDEDGVPVIIQCLPLTPWMAAATEWQRPLRMVILHRRSERTPSFLLRQIYKFTPTEIQIARHLVRDLTLAEIAHASDVKVGTIRSQVKSMLHKTDCRRQAELVRLLIGLQLFS